ncbi:methylmalonyl Co-A mutase-associated GTPase MeaB [bacterium]|nr:methylmalonyl Co-A mutase-associated GTPase MeaB [bacterium]
MKSLLAKFNDGSSRALAKIVSIIENRTEGYEKLMAELYHKPNQNSYRVGITGPPGAGKSSLLDRIALTSKYSDYPIGIVAIDPSSSFTGGAILGDRVRMRDLATKENIYIRSMASRGSMGGLSEATKDVLVALEAFGKEFILLETVGVGQVELDIIDASDTVVVVLTPESGDSIQAMKSGIIEIADIFAVNKSDREGAEYFAMELSTILDLKERTDTSWIPPIINTIASTGEGVDDLVSAIESHKKFKLKTGLFKAHRIRQIQQKIKETIISRIDIFIENEGLLDNDLDQIAEDIIVGQNDPYTFVDSKFPIRKFRLIK